MPMVGHYEMTALVETQLTMLPQAAIFLVGHFILWGKTFKIPSYMYMWLN